MAGLSFSSSSFASLSDFSSALCGTSVAGQVEARGSGGKMLGGVTGVSWCSRGRDEYQGFLCLHLA